MKQTFLELRCGHIIPIRLFSMRNKHPICLRHLFAAIPYHTRFGEQTNGDCIGRRLHVFSIFYLA